MTAAEKLAMVKAILRIDASDTSEDALIGTYLTMAGREIMGWRYSNANPENVPEDVPAEYEMTQVQGVINGYTQSGIEGQILSIENGVHRHFRYSDMVEYIRANVIPVAGVLRKAEVTTTAAGDDSFSQPSADSSLGEGANGEGDGEEETNEEGADGADANYGVPTDDGADGDGDGEGT